MSPQMLPPAAPPAPAVRPRRLVSLDCARALAIIGMIAVNVGPQQAGGLLEKLFMLPYGRASLLFMFLAGIGLGLLTHPARRTPWREQWVLLVWRSMLLLAAGLGLQAINHGVSVILTVYGVLFLAAIPMTRMGTRALAVSTGVMAILGPLGWIAILVARDETFRGRPILLPATPMEVMDRILITGPYPALVWVVPLLAGLTLSRFDLASRQIQMRLLICGFVATIGGLLLSRMLGALTGIDPTDGGFARLLASYDHSEAPLWLLSGVGSAACLVGLFCIIEPWLGRHAQALINLGRLSLTMYVVHLILIAVFVRPDPHTTIEGIAFASLISLFCLVCAHLWVTHYGRGPLERLLRVPFLRTRRPVSS